MKKHERAFLKSKAVKRDRQPAKAKFSNPHRLLTIYAPPGGGKTSLALSTTKNSCLHGKNVLYIDVNGGLTDNIIEGCGLGEFRNIKKFRFVSCLISNVNDIVTVAKKLMPAVQVIVIDSINNVIPDSLMTGSVEEHTWKKSHSEQNRLLRKLKAEAELHGVTLIVTSVLSLTFNHESGCVYTPGNWYSGFSDIYVKLAHSRHLHPQAIDEYGMPQFMIDRDGAHSVPDMDRIIGSKVMMDVFCKSDIGDQYHASRIFHDLYFGSGFNLDFTQCRFKNLLLAKAPEPTDTDKRSNRKGDKKNGLKVRTITVPTPVLPETVT